ncbi:MAG: NAD(P)/FAD-dependent oxidoreductase [archaeon]|nr:NAD(P)/FAD-dependent oxidoreductase [archaeon]
MAKTFDVAVIGAGPAGGSAALHSQKNGLNTLIIEEHQEIGVPVHCGECLSDVAIKKFNFNIPKKVIAKDVKGVRVVFPDRTAPVLSEDGYVLEKHLWEQWIAEQAVNEGAQLELNTRVSDLQRQNGKWKIKAGEKEFEAKVLIDASGVQSFSSSKLGLNEKRFDAVIGIQYEMLDVKTDGYLDFYLWPKLSPHGYCWMIPKNDGRANVGLVTNEKNKAKAFLDEFIKEPEFAGKKIVKTFGGLIPSSGPLPKTFSEGLMLVGDAAGFTSPVFEGGSHLGLMSGKFSADVAKKAVEKNDFSLQAMSEYEQLWKAEFPPYAKIIQGRDALYGLSDDELSALGRALPGELHNLSLADKISTGLKLLFHKPSVLAKGIRPIARAFSYSQARYYGW